MIACPECDALQETPRRLSRGRSLHCWRCRSVLERGSGKSASFTFALALTGLLLFLIGNSFPLVSLEAQGNGVTTTLFGAAIHFWNQDLAPVSVLVLVTTVLAPAFDLGVTLYLLAGMLRQDAGHADAMPPGSAALLRIVQKVRPWGMLEVFMLGALVSVVKLGQLASVIPGPALFSIGALTLVLAAINGSFDVRDAWSRMPVHDGATAEEGTLS